MRHLLVALSLLIASARSADAQVSVGIALPSVSIGINVPVYPELVVVPGYPVYYAPGTDWNYFFYDGVYWVYQGDSWYASSWYNGPWRIVRPEHVPLYVLRVPVRYYRNPPPYFRGWRADAPPRWGEHWGRGWERRHRGWDRWEHRSVPRPAPLPVYQREYSGDRYPHAPEQQHVIRSDSYRYRPREPFAREHFVQPGHPGGRRAEAQRDLPPGRQQPHDGDRMHRPDAPGPQRPHEDGRTYRRDAPAPQRPHEDGRTYRREPPGPSQPREDGRTYRREPPGQPQPRDEGRAHRPGPAEDHRDDGNDDRRHGRR
jgi:hypothetical protein